MRMIDPMKDVDGLHPFNAGQLFLGTPTLVGATPRRRHAPARRIPDPGFRARGRSSSVEACSSAAARDAAAARERDRDDLPLAYRRSSPATRSTPTSSSQQ